MANEVDKKAVSDFDFGMLVIHAKTAYEHWCRVSLAWKQATVELGRLFWTAHQNLRDEKNTKQKKTVSIETRQNSTVSIETVSGFCKSVGIPRATFYRFINRVQVLIDEGLDILTLPADMKLVDAEVKKTSREIELEKKITDQENEIRGREIVLEDFKKDILEEQAKHQRAQEELKKLRTALKKLQSQSPQTKTNTAQLDTRLKAVEERESKMDRELDWYNTVIRLKLDLKSLVSIAQKFILSGNNLLDLKSVPKTTRKSTPSKNK